MSNLTREQILCTQGHFTWDFGMHFFIETPLGNFLWSAPDYGGDNTLTLYRGSYAEYFKEDCFGRGKGEHEIARYCGDQVKIILD